MTTIHGVRSFEGLRARARTLDLVGAPLLVAALPDIIRSKRAAGRPRDLAVIDVLEKALEEGAKQEKPPRGPRPRALTGPAPVDPALAAAAAGSAHELPAPARRLRWLRALRIRFVSDRARTSARRQRGRPGEAERAASWTRHTPAGLSRVHDGRAARQPAVRDACGPASRIAFNARRSSRPGSLTSFVSLSLNTIVARSDALNAAHRGMP